MAVMARKKEMPFVARSMHGGERDGAGDRQAEVQIIYLHLKAII
jgi:hypothetical protein